jgi:hypothetical protein
MRAISSNFVLSIPSVYIYFYPYVDLASSTAPRAGAILILGIISTSVTWFAHVDGVQFALTTHLGAFPHLYHRRLGELPVSLR